ncbi:phage major capsid protein [Ureibacillus aquaedulcis]|uniref:Phage major capsid protein n=1 Tax=Ureibacillus aquaedulcis TaxID=3058421 RepID=A0ABT8GPL8_9BACL|nr:phage major capsid protein [Ureibacillus sp. BA0131]MDN4493362.1 phage major capsid protein [Ureibacillus sp. BA0131]
MELRVQSVELTSNEDGSMTVSGYVNKTNQFSNVLGTTKKFKEKIAKGAFHRAIQNAQKDIDFLAEHNNKKILASTRNGSLELREDDKGLFMSATIAPTSWGKDYYELIKCGILKNMSFGFRTVKDNWRNISPGLFERTIEELELFEVSVVRDPAYSNSTIAARGIDLVEKVVPLNIQNEKKEENKNIMKTEYRYNIAVKETEEETEIREFNNGLRNLQMTSGSSSVIPETVANMIVKKLEETSSIFSQARKIPSVNGTVKIPRETVVGIGSFVGEGKSLIEEAFSLGEVKLQQKRVGAFVSATQQLLNDSAINMADYISSLLATRTYKAIEKSMLKGTDEDEFSGIVPNEEVFEHTLSVGASDQELLDKLLDMTLTIHPEYLQGSQFILSRSFFNRVSKLKDAAGKFYLQNGMNNGTINYLLFGLQVVVTDSLDAGDVGEVPCIVANIQASYAVMIKKSPTITIVQDTDSALRGTVGFLFDSYLDGVVYNPDAIAKLTIVA